METEKTTYFADIVLLNVRPSYICSNFASVVSNPVLMERQICTYIFSFDLGCFCLDAGFQHKVLPFAEQEKITGKIRRIDAVAPEMAVRGGLPNFTCSLLRV